MRSSVVPPIVHPPPITTAAIAAVNIGKGRLLPATRKSSFDFAFLNAKIPTPITIAKYAIQTIISIADIIHNPPFEKKILYFLFLATIPIKS